VKAYKMVPGSDAVEVIEFDPSSTRLDVLAGKVIDGACEVISANGWLSRHVPTDSPYGMLLWVRDFGWFDPSAKVNWRAWGFYGYSPVVGPALLTTDSTDAGGVYPWHPDAEKWIEMDYQDERLAWVRMNLEVAYDRLRDELPDLAGRWE
jgi:hypothetical protein